MSYHIIYDKQFVKIADLGYIPLILSGDNNVWKAHGKGRVRYWGLMTRGLDNPLVRTEEQMLQEMEDWRQDLIASNKRRQEEYDDWDKWDDKRFGYFSGTAIRGSTYNTTFGMVKGIILTGVRKALTIEEMALQGVRVKFYTSGWTDTEERLQQLGMSELFFIPKTTEELLEQMEGLEEYRTKVGIHVTLQTWDHDNAAKRLRRIYFPRKRKTRAVFNTGDTKYLVLVKGLGYLHQLTRNGFRYTESSNFATGYHTKQKAEARIKAVSARFHGYDFELREITL